MGCSGGLLTRRCAPQDGRTPLFIAAENGHAEVVQLLVKARADKDAPEKVKEGRGLDVGRTNGVCDTRCTCFLLGVAARPLTASVLSRVCEPCLPVNGRGSRCLTSAPGAGRELVSRVALQT